MFKFIVISMLTAILAMTTVTAKAGGELYLDIGATYVKEFGVTERLSVSIGKYTISGEASATLDVDAYSPMVRLGYLYNGFGAEVDTVGVPSQNLVRYNVYYRFSFK